MNEELQELLRRQKEISKEISRLAEDSRNITKEIYNIVESNNSNADWLKDMVKEDLTRCGFTVSSDLVGSTRVLVGKKGEKTISINVRVSKYRTGSYNGWYTLTKDDLEQIDYYAFGYLDKNGGRNFGIVPKEEILVICNILKATSKGKIHLGLKGDDASLQEVHSQVNLSKYIGKLGVVD